MNKSFIQFYTTIYILIIVGYTSSGQFSVLFVDDSKDEFLNSQRFANALDSLHISYDYFDIEYEGSPSLEMLNQHDVVIWHTSSWGQNLGFWSENDIDNEILKSYLNQDEAKLWLVGNDFLFDRYGGAPKNFEEGSFVKDYLGIIRYKAQSYVNDGNMGVPYVSTSDSSPIANLPNINWQFDFLYYADALAIDQLAMPIYIMDGPNYPLANEITGVYYNIPQGGEVITFAFDLALANNDALIRETSSTILTWWQNSTNNNNDIVVQKGDVSIFPTIVDDMINIEFEDSWMGDEINVEVINNAGLCIEEFSFVAQQYSYKHILRNKYTTGNYFFIVKNKSKYLVKPFAIIIK